VPTSEVLLLAQRHAKLSNRHRGDLKLFIAKRYQPVFQIECAIFTVNHHVGVQNYRHLPAGACRNFRAARRSRRQALASLFGKRTLARAAAKSRPKQTFSLSGASLATGWLFFSRTKVTF
jgi:hypothetical protein